MARRWPPRSEGVSVGPRVGYDAAYVRLTVFAEDTT